MIERTTEIRVRYADTDQMKQVYYGKYFEYFEQGRTDFLRSLGLAYAELERQGFLLPVLEAHARYKQPALYDDLLRVQTRLRDMPAVRFRLEYSIMRNDNPDILAEGYTEHTFIRASTRRPVRAPELFLDVLRKAFKQEDH